MTSTFNQKFHVSSDYLYITRTSSVNIAGNTVTINSTGRWDGSTLESFGGSGTDAAWAGYSIYGVGSDVVYLGGGFTTVSGLSIPYAAKWDVSSWSDMNSLGSTVNAVINQIAYDSSNGYVYFGNWQAGTTANRIVKYDQATNTWSGIATFTVSNYPKMSVDRNSNLWLGYSSTVKRYSPGTDTWTDISSTPQSSINDIRCDNVSGKVYFAAGNIITYIMDTSTGPHVELTGIQGGASGARGVDVLVDGSVVAAFQSPSSGDATNIVQLYNGSSWTGIYRTTNNSGNLSIHSDANGNLVVYTNSGAGAIGKPPYTNSDWYNLSDAGVAGISFGGSIQSSLSKPEITISGGSTHILTKDNPALISVSATNSPTSWSITPALTDISMNTSTGEISGMPITFDISGTTHVITATNADGAGTANLTIMVRDGYINDMIDNAVYSVAETVSAASLSIASESTIITDISAYIPNNNNGLKRSSLLKMILSRPDNSGYQFITSTRDSLKLPTVFTKNKIRVYRNNTTIDLTDLSGDEGAYIPIRSIGDTGTFLNVGGNGNTLIFTANGDNTYDISGNGSDLGSATDGDEIILYGVSFYVGSVGTEGTAGDAICLTGDALVTTPSGDKRIDQISRGDSILLNDGTEHIVHHAIRVVTNDILVKISANALDTGVPNRDTVMTQEHMLFYKDVWYRAGDLLFLKGVSAIKSQPYQYVYHIDSKTSDTMVVNNIIMETIDRDNINVHTRNNKINIKSGMIEHVGC